MKSIYERVLGGDFKRLHPQIQRRFGFSSADGIASIGRGVMDEIWKGRFYIEPFLHVGSWRRESEGGVGNDSTASSPARWRGRPWTRRVPCCPSARWSCL